MQNIAQTLQYLCSSEFVILLLIMIAFGDKAKIVIPQLIDLITGTSARTKKIEKFQQKSKKLNEILDFYREKYRAGRISFFTFHNGGKDFSGIPFYKFSCIDEVVDRGVASRLKDGQNYHLCVVVDWTSHFIRNEQFCLQCEKCDHCTNHTVRALLEERGCKAAVLSPVWDGKELAGFVMLEWLNEKFMPNDNFEEALSDMPELSKTIEIERFR